MESMTGYGFSALNYENTYLQVEVKTVNSRSQEARIHLPEPANALEMKLLKLVKERIGRGRVDLYLSFQHKSSSYQITPDLNLAKEYLKALKELYLGLEIKEKVKISYLLEKDEIFKVTQELFSIDTFEDIILEVAEKAIHQLLIMRRQEGERLKEELLLGMKKLADLLVMMEERAPSVVEFYRDRLTIRLEHLLGEKGDIFHEDRLLFEVAAFAERCDIREELARIKSHLQNLQEVLQMEERSKGKKMDFIGQELHREVNTIASKANDLEIINGVIEMKSHIDAIREQAKNIE